MPLSKKTTNVKEALRNRNALLIEPQPPPNVDQAAIEQGRKQIESRRKDLAGVKARAVELYGIPAGGLAGIPTIESSFHFASLQEDAEFHYLHVEPLLEQTLLLLERCSGDRSEYDSLRIEKWKLQLELDRFFSLDQIERQERETGRDTLAYERAAFNGNAERSLAENHARQEAQLKSLLENLLATGFNRRMAARELVAWLSSYPLKDSELGGDAATYSYDGNRRTKPDHLYEAAREEMDEEAWEQTFSLMAQRFSAMASAEAGRMRGESFGLLEKWSRAEIQFRTARAQAAREPLWEKAFQVQSAGGLLNCNERLETTEKSFASHFREALARTEAVRRGLKELYEYAPPFPKEGTSRYFDEVLRWVREAKRKTAQISHSEQQYVLALSVKELMGQQWEAGRAGAEWTFDVPEELFPGQANVRLRGVSLTLGAPVPEDPASSKKRTPVLKEGQPERPRAEGFWSARISVPPTGTMRLPSGTAIELDQKLTPACHLGRVTDQNSANAPEVAGVNILHNASPIGKGWNLALSRKSTGGTQTAELGDVVIYLHLAVRSRMA